MFRTTSIAKLSRRQAKGVPQPWMLNAGFQDKSNSLSSDPQCASSKPVKEVSIANESDLATRRLLKRLP